jgi:hypothetical protein
MNFFQELKDIAKTTRAENLAKKQEQQRQEAAALAERNRETEELQAKEFADEKSFMIANALVMEFKDFIRDEVQNSGYFPSTWRVNGRYNLPPFLTRQKLEEIHPLPASIVPAMLEILNNAEELAGIKVSLSGLEAADGEEITASNKRSLVYKLVFDVKYPEKVAVAPIRMVSLFSAKR